MPIDYSNAKIYQIIPTVPHDAGDIYIGSSVRPLSERMSKHRNRTSCRCKLLFDKYGVQNCKIELLEYFPCETKEQLLKREGELQRAHTCVNKQISGQTRKEYYEANIDKMLKQSKQYYELHKDQIKEYKKEYQINNDVHLKEYANEYRANNKDKIKIRHKIYSDKNKEHLKEYKKQYYLKKKAEKLLNNL